MLFCDQSASEPVARLSTSDARKVRLGGGYRLPASTADAGKVRPGDGDRLSKSTADTGLVRLGGGYRLPVQPV